MKYRNISKHNTRAAVLTLVLAVTLLLTTTFSVAFLHGNAASLQEKKTGWYAMQKDAGVELAELKVDGGASRNNLLMQFQADILGTSVIRPQVTETTALGAAYLAGLATGMYKSTDEIKVNRKIAKTFVPEKDEAWRKEKLTTGKKAVSRSLDWK